MCRNLTVCDAAVNGRFLVPFPPCHSRCSVFVPVQNAGRYGERCASPRALACRNGSTLKRPRRAHQTASGRSISTLKFAGAGRMVRLFLRRLHTWHPTNLKILSQFKWAQIRARGLAGTSWIRKTQYGKREDCVTNFNNRDVRERAFNKRRRCGELICGSSPHTETLSLVLSSEFCCSVFCALSQCFRPKTTRRLSNRSWPM